MSTFTSFLGKHKWEIAGISVLIVSCLLSLFAPSEDITLGRIFSVMQGANDPTAALILNKIRLPRMFGGLVCGCALSVSGLLLQYAMSNELCAPGIMGINSGAGLFVLLSALLFPGQVGAKGAFAFAGALLSALCVYLIGLKAGASKTRIILSGVAVSSLMTAGINVIITLFPETVTDKVAFSLGGLQYIPIRQLHFSGIVTAVCCIAALIYSGGLDLFQLGDETAAALGLPVKAYRFACVGLASLLAASAVSLCGLLGFVGLIIPNVFRMLGVPGAGKRIRLCILWGSSFLILCDLLAGRLFYPYELPAGAVLSCIGAPFFILVIMRRTGHT
ncbi:MAG: iron ABC transporter permease [Lachnospiraceae bacterium]|nr:iron ABC transporter permease [Lachnospiraceae bacterium]